MIALSFASFPDQPFTGPGGPGQPGPALNAFKFRLNDRPRLPVLRSMTRRLLAVLDEVLG
jgi:hypothetical protein